MATDRLRIDQQSRAKSNGVQGDRVLPEARRAVAREVTAVDHRAPVAFLCRKPKTMRPLGVGAPRKQEAGGGEPREVIHVAQDLHCRPVVPESETGTRRRGRARRARTNLFRRLHGEQAVHEEDEGDGERETSADIGAHNCGFVGGVVDVRSATDRVQFLSQYSTG